MANTILSVDRRTFVKLLGAGIATPRLPWEQASGSTPNTVFYSAVGGDLTLYSMDIDHASLVKRDTVSMPANVQYAWPHPSRQHFYVGCCGGGPGHSAEVNFRTG